MAKVPIQELLTTEVWEALTDNYGLVYGDDSPIYLFLSDIDEELDDFVETDFHGLLTIFDNPVSSDYRIAEIAFLHMGDAFKRIFDVLTAEYDPFENFFTKGDFKKSGGFSVEKKGSEESTPTGKMKVVNKGQSTSDSEGSFSVGQGTTYDSATTVPPTTTGQSSDLYNLSRDIRKSVVKQVLGDNNGNNLPTTETSYENYKVTKSYNDREDETTYNNYKEETDKKGNSGIFSKQDLAMREIKLRLKARIVPIYVRMVVDTFSIGVWSE